MEDLDNLDENDKFSILHYDDDVGKLQMQPVEAYERPMAKVDVKDRVNVIYA